MPIEHRDSWFFAKSIKVERHKKVKRVKQLLNKIEAI